MKLPFACVLTLVAGMPLLADTWTIQQGTNPDSPGKMVLIERNKKPVARFVYGPGQMKPFLHVYGENGELLTNGGLDAQGQPTGQYPHHRGVFIGWKINSELGNFDLWHMNNGGRMEVLDFERLDATEDSATIVANIVWRAGKADASGSDLLLKEKRTLTISRPGDKRTQVDARFQLTPVRDLNFAGDLQHSGVHFRATNAVTEREKDTLYLSAPDKVAKGSNLKWCRFAFPVGNRWYSATQFNAPANPVEELSTRTYGRFGYFFKRSLKKSETLDLQYRFVIEFLGSAGPGDLQSARSQAESSYRDFATGARS
jgi:hypothetical protein